MDRKECVTHSWTMFRMEELYVYLGMWLLWIFLPSGTGPSHRCSLEGIEKEMCVTHSRSMFMMVECV